MDPLHDPDDDALLDPRQARDLAGLLENARLASAMVRYGTRSQVGVATVVLNQDNPLPQANHACGLWGTLAEVGSTLLELENVFAEAGRTEAVVYASPTTVAEIEGIADDAGWRAVEEGVALLHRVDQVRTDTTRRCVDADLTEAIDLLADEEGLSVAAEQRLLRNVGHRVDDPYCVLRVIEDVDASGQPRVVGFAQGFVHRGVGLIEHVVVRPGRRRRGFGRALTTETVEELRDRGALLVAAHSEEGGATERFAEKCGFEAVYPVTAFARGIDELL